MHCVRKSSTRAGGIGHRVELWAEDRVIELGIPEVVVVVAEQWGRWGAIHIRDRSEARAQLGLKQGRIVCFIGNLVPEKGPDILIEALAHTDPSILASLKVIFVGNGHSQEELSRRAGELGIGEVVQFAGRRPPSEIPIWMAAMDLLCLPSRREGCPNVVLEALASGRPVVASSVGGVPDLISERNGIQVVPNDPARLGRAISEALQRDWSPGDLRSSVASLTWSDMGKKVHQVLCSAVQLHRMSSS